MLWSDYQDVPAELDHRCLQMAYDEEANGDTLDITKTRLFKYTENFTTKNWKFSDKNSDIFFLFFFLFQLKT